jgi:hypothetical protein
MYKSWSFCDHHPVIFLGLWVSIVEDVRYRASSLTIKCSQVLQCNHWSLLHDIQGLSKGLVFWWSIGKGSPIYRSLDQIRNNFCFGKHHFDCKLHSYFRGYWVNDFTWLKEGKIPWRVLNNMLDSLSSWVVFVLCALYIP